MRQTARPVKDEPRKISTWWLTLPATVVLLGGMATAAAPLLHLDESREGMVLTYPPRYLCLAVTIAASSVLAACGCRKRAWMAMSCCGLLGVQFGWGPASLGAAIDKTDGFTMLAFNVNDEAGHVSQLAELCREEQVDFLLLQEVHPGNREAFVNGLAEYQFFDGDVSKNVPNSRRDSFSSLIAIHRSLLETETPRIEMAITGFRTFALRLPIRTASTSTTDSSVRGIWLVNVHSAESFQTAGRLDSLDSLYDRTSQKAARHLDERNRLEAWLARHRDEPVILGGDFNAPWNSHNLRIAGLDNAHLSSGAGPHLTYPRAFPIWGQDHVLGTLPVEFLSYRLLDTGYSNHFAQIGRFRIRGFRRERDGS